MKCDDDQYFYNLFYTLERADEFVNLQTEKYKEFWGTGKMMHFFRKLIKSWTNKAEPIIRKRQFLYFMLWFNFIKKKVDCFCNVGFYEIWSLFLEESGHIF